MEEKAMTSDPKHPFEASGCGRAPFRVVGSHTMPDVVRWVEKNGLTIEVQTRGVTGCRHCAQAISEVYVIRDADGRTFPVGSSCVRKTGDARLWAGAKAEAKKLAKAKRDKAKARAAERRQAALAAWQALPEAERAAILASEHEEPWAAASALVERGRFFHLSFGSQMRTQMLSERKIPTLGQVELLRKLVRELPGA